MREFKITEKQIMELNKFIEEYSIQCSQEYLRRLFPAAFEPEWEEVPLSEFTLASLEGRMLLKDRKIRGYTNPLPISLSINETSGFKDDYKIESDKIWRRKA